MEYSCPFCEYENSKRSSVEAHITGKSDSSHAGKVGRMYRSDIEQEARPESIGERVATITGNDPGKEESIREEIQAVRSSIEELADRVDEIAAEVEELHDRPSAESIKSASVRAARDEVSDHRKAINRLGELLAQEVVGKKRKCPECGTSVMIERETFRTPAFEDPQTGPVKCSNCDAKVNYFATT